MKYLFVNNKKKRHMNSCVGLLKINFPTTERFSCGGGALVVLPLAIIQVSESAPFFYAIVTQIGAYVALGKIPIGQIVMLFGFCTVRTLQP